MKKCLAAVLLIFTTFLSSLAHATSISGQITALNPAANDTLNSAACLYFQLNNSSTWYAMLYSDGGFEFEISVMMAAYLTGQSITVNIGSPVSACGGSTQAASPIIGTVSAGPSSGS
jgi:hypothetical protein